MGRGAHPRGSFVRDKGDEDRGRDVPTPPGQEGQGRGCDTPVPPSRGSTPDPTGHPHTDDWTCSWETPNVGFAPKTTPNTTFTNSWDSSPQTTYLVAGALTLCPQALRTRVLVHHLRTAPPASRWSVHLCPQALRTIVLVHHLRTAPPATARPRGHGKEGVHIRHEDVRREPPDVPVSSRPVEADVVGGGASAETFGVQLPRPGGCRSPVPTPKVLEDKGCLPGPPFVPVWQPDPRTTPVERTVPKARSTWVGTSVVAVQAGALLGSVRETLGGPGVRVPPLSGGSTLVIEGLPDQQSTGHVSSPTEGRAARGLTGSGSGPVWGPTPSGGSPSRSLV